MSTDFSRVDRLVDQSIKAGLSNLGNDVKKRAVILAPKDTGRLRNSARVDVSPVKDMVTVSFNTEYAKNRHYNNNLHPSTRLYLTNALKSITNISRYFRSF